MDTKLVWVQAGMETLIEGAPTGLEIVTIPETPADDARVGDVQMIVIGGNHPLGDTFSKMTSLEVVQTYSAGVDYVVGKVPDTVSICSARGSYAIVAEWVVGAILAAYKSFPYFRDEQLAGHWASGDIRRVTGAKVLLVGYGGIGAGVEERLAPFGAEFVRVARSARPGVHAVAELPGLVPEADIVVLLVPLTAETEGLVDADFLARMQDGALLVNVARGKVVHTDALIAACESGRIAAVLDVTDPEPLPDGHRLFATPNVFITPHMAGGALALPEVLGFLRRQLERFADGEPLENVVTHGY